MFTVLSWTSHGKCFESIRLTCGSCKFMKRIDFTSVILYIFSFLTQSTNQYISMRNSSTYHIKKEKKCVLHKDTKCGHKFNPWPISCYLFLYSIWHGEKNLCHRNFYLIGRRQNKHKLNYYKYKFILNKVIFMFCNIWTFLI